VVPITPTGTTIMMWQNKPSTLPNLIAVVALLATAVNAYAEDPAAKAVNQTRELADRELSTMRQFASDQSARALGFASEDKGANASLGEPIAVFMVRLDELQRYEPHTDPNKLLHDAETVIYPVITDGQVRSSIFLEKTNQQWNAGRFGGANLARLLNDARQQNSAKKMALATGSQFAVEVPALNAYFMGWRSQEKLMLSPVMDDPALKLSKNETLPAQEIFTRLAVAAREHNGRPR
jgi:hypothetical protein